MRPRADRLPRTLGLVATIRGQILLAFIAMAGIVGLVGIHAAYRIQQGGHLVAETYDRSLMAINYARAASADFALMRLTASKAVPPGDAGALQTREALVDEYRQSLTEDLAIAAERSRSARASEAAARAQAAINAWVASRGPPGASPAGDPDSSGAYVVVADRELDHLVNYTAGDGFAYRQAAAADVEAGWRLTVAVLAAALTLAMVVSWLLSRRILRQVTAASQVAGLIAGGQLDGPMPRGGPDELGQLLKSLSTMRESLRKMMLQEVARKQSAEARLFDAVQSSHEGIVLVDRAGRVVLANDQALSAVAPADAGSVVGADWSSVSASLPPPGPQGEMLMPDGRWLQVSRSATRDGGLVAVLNDISALKSQEERLETTNQRLDTALDAMSQGLCLFDADGRLAVVNARYSEIFDLPPGLVRLGMTVRETIALRVAHGAHGRASVDDLVREKMSYVDRREPTVIAMPVAGGRILSVAIRPAPNGGWAATYEDMTERRLAEEQVAFMARHDALTSLANRRLFTDRMQEAIDRLGPDKGFAVLCLDLDRFKDVNDTLGHAMGDLLLQTVADRLRSCVRACDTIARFGGDEFAIIQAGPASRNDMAALAQRIIETVAEPYLLDGRRASIGVSVGIAVAPADGAASDALLRNADMAMYRAKAGGRGTWCFFEPEMHARISARSALGQDMRDALARGDFMLVYQPIYHVRREEVSGFEALARWKHPTRGIVGPIDFIPVAEEQGLIAQLGAWVLREACAEAARWPGAPGINVNVSPAQFTSEDLVGSVTSALAASGLAAERLSLEITETVLLTQSPATLAKIRSLRQLGVKISLDDFGTGYSSLSYLGEFPIDQLKLDRSFVRQLDAEGGGAIVRAIIGLAASLSMRVVAEGVETAEQFCWLRDNLCDSVQGFLIAPALPASEVPHALADPQRFADALPNARARMHPRLVV